MTTLPPSSRPLSIHNLVLGVAIGLAILCAAITLVVVLERSRSEPELGSAVERLDEARDELSRSAQTLREATVALQAAARTPTTINVMAPTAPASTPASTTSITSEDPSAPALYCPVPERCVIPRAVVEGMLADPSNLAKSARVMPSVRDGVTRGFKFYGLRPGSLVRDLGFKNGDLLKSINGTELDGMEAAMSLYAKLRHATTFALEIERKGELLRKDITIE